MLAVAIFLLFTAQGFAKDGGGASKNYHDSLQLPNPHYKISYIYEQRRAHEDLEIDQIEEEIGNYMHYQPSKTSTKKEVVHDRVKNFKDNIYHGTFETSSKVLESHQLKHKDVTSTLAPLPEAPKLQAPTNPRFPTATKFSSTVSRRQELKDVSNNDVAGSHLNRPNFPAQGPTSTHHRRPNHRLHISPTTTSKTPVEEKTQANHAATKEHIFLSPTTPVPNFQRQNAQNTLAKVRLILDNIKQDSIKHAPGPVYRGNYKFSLDDINDMHTSATPKVSQLKENPIPPVPTLSPWYDGYGK